MAAMVDVMTAPGAVERAAALHDLLARLVASTHDDRSVTHLIGWNLNLLFRRIVERSGETGEHYIAATRAEYRHIWLAAAGGGLLTGGTAAIKATLSTLHAPDFVHGVLYGLNYAISFLLLHRWGLVLATKQPAMTAATLATIIRERRGGDRVDEIIEFTARICRSQLAAAIGNVAVVAATAFSIDGLWRLVVGRPYMEAAEATATYQAMSPLNSGTLFYAALTGVILYLAAIAGGWFDNFCAYHRLPDAVAQHPLRRTLGRARLARWGASLDRNAAAWATNVALGFMLGMTPAIGHFLGLPLDVRHVTLNTGILALASASLGDRWFLEGFFLTGLAGIAVMFVLNLSVSFLLSLGNAARAYDVPNAEVWDLLRRLYRRFVTAPRDFILPPRRDPAAPAPPHQA
jgi:site-specific recombinase